MRPVQSFVFLSILGIIHSGGSYDIRDAIKINWRFHGGDIAHEDSHHKEASEKSTRTTGAESHHEDHHDGHWTPPKLKLGLNFRIVGGKWPFFWTWKQNHPPVTDATEVHTNKASYHPTVVHHHRTEHSPAVAINTHSNTPDIHETNHNSIQTEVPQPGSANGDPISYFTFQDLRVNSQPPPQRPSSHAERIIRKFGIDQNQAIQTDAHSFQSSSSFRNPNLHNDPLPQNNLNSYATLPGSNFPTDGSNSFTYPHISPHGNSHHMQPLREVVQPSSTNNIPVVKALPTISHPNNLKYSTIHSTQPKILNVPSESKHLASFASRSYPQPLNSHLSHLQNRQNPQYPNCHNCHFPYIRGTFAHALINEIQNLPVSEDDKLLKALKVILTIAQDEAYHRDQYEKQNYMRRR